MVSVERWPRLKQLYFAARELGERGRAELLATLPEADRDLASALADLLAAQAPEDASLAAALGAEREAVLADVAAWPARFAAGRRIGVWEIDRPLGEGGMGAVFLARRSDQAFRQVVAIKLVRGALPTRESIERFRRERRTLAELCHPGIAALVDGGETEEGIPYLALEYVDGERIDSHCDRLALGPRERLALFFAVCDAVAHAHRRLVVHRDLKPSNVLVDREGHPKLLDFGIAKLLAEESVPGLTRTFERVLTLEYAAPEQLRGEPITTATDVYALGGLLYRLLAGAAPYRLPDDDFRAVERIVCETAPERPSLAAARGGGDARRRARFLAGDLDNILLTALRREPERRYASVDAFADDLRRFLDDLPVRARADSLGYRVRKFVARHRVGVAASVLVAGALVAGASLALWQGLRARAESRRAEEINAFLASILTTADPVRGAGRATTVAELLDGASERLADDLAGQPRTEAGLRETLAETYFHLGLADEAEREARRALALRATAPPADGARARVLLATALRGRGALAEAEAELRRALADTAGIEPPPLARATGLDGLLVVLRQLGRRGEALSAGDEAARLLRTSFPAERAALASTLNNLALVHGELGALDDAERLHREALAEIRAARGERHPQTAEALANLASVLDLQERYAEAEPLYRDALVVQEVLLGERHPDFVRTLTSFANLLWLDRRPADAETPATRAVSLARDGLGAEHPLTAYAENVLGGVLLDLGRASEAEPYIRAALASRRRTLSATHWLVASARSSLGAALLAQGRLDEAERELRAAHEILIVDPGPDHDRTRLNSERVAELARRRDG